jgi:hypothetical protein
VRHVDHAHQAEGDREAEGGDEQDAAETDAAEERAEEVDERAVVLDRAQRFARGGSDRDISGVLRLLDRALDGVGGGERVQFLERGERGDFDLVLFVLQLDERDGLAQDRLHLCIGFDAEPGGEGGKFFDVLGEADRLDGGDAFGRIGGGEVGEIEHGLHRTPERGGVFGGGEIGGNQAERAGRARESGAGVDAERGLGAVVVLRAGEKDGCFRAVGRGVDEELVGAPGFEERRNAVFGHAHEGRDEAALFGDVLGQGRANDDLARCIRGAGGQAGRQREQERGAGQSSEKIHH